MLTSKDRSHQSLDVIRAPATGPASSARADNAATAAPSAPRLATAARALDALSLAEGGLLADVGVILDLASIYLPLIGAVLAPTVPTPFVLLTLRRGPRVALLAGAVAAFLVTVLAGPHFGWRMGLEAVIGILLGWAMRQRLRPILIWGMGTALVTAVTFAAALGVIILTGLPIRDIVGELRNGLGSVAWVVAAGASLFGGQGQWLAVRPTLVVVGLLALRLWPLLLLAYITAFALPNVALYYIVANATVRVLGHDVRPFPPRWVLRLVRMLTLIMLAPVLLPRRAVHALRHRRHTGPCP